MAQIPRYQSPGLVYADMPTLQPVDLQEQLQSNKRIGAALDQMVNITTKKAEEYAVESAIKYTIDQPLSETQIKESLISGEDPIKSALTGGTTWNNAVKKLYGMQASTSLSNIAQEHFINVLDRVNKGEINDKDMLSAELNAPVKEHTNIFASLDPELAVKYSNKLTTTAHNYYVEGLKTLKNNAEKVAGREADKTLTLMDKDLTLFLSNKENRDPKLVDSYINKLLDESHNTYFVNTPNPEQLREKAAQQLDKTKQLFIAQEVASMFAGKDVATAIKAVKGGKTKVSELYNTYDIIDQKGINSLIHSEMELMNSTNAAMTKQLTQSLSGLESVAKAGEPINQDELKFVQSNITPGHPMYNERLKVERIISFGDRMKNSSMAQLNQEKTMIEQAAHTINPKTGKAYGFTGQQLEEYNTITKMISNFDTKMDKDFGGFVLANNPSLQRITPTIYKVLTSDTSNPEQQAMLTTEFANIARERKFAFDKAGKHYLKEDYQLLEESEVNDIIPLIKSAEPSVKINTVASITKAFGPEASYKIFQQLSVKDSDIGHLGQLYVDRGSADKVILDFAEGIQRQKMGEKLAKNIKAEDASALFNDVFGSAYSSAPGMQAILQKAAVTYYIGKSAGNPSALAEMSDEDYKDSLRAVSGQIKGSKYTFGGVYTYNGVKTLLPSLIPHEKFDTAAKSASPLDWALSVTDAKGNYLYKDNGDGKVVRLKDNQVVDPMLAFDGKQYALPRLRDSVFKTTSGLGGNVAEVYIGKKYDYRLSLQDPGSKNGEPLFVNLLQLYNLGSKRPSWRVLTPAGQIDTGLESFGFAP